VGPLARDAVGRFVAIRVTFVVELSAPLLLTVCVVEEVLSVLQVKFVVLRMGWFQVAEIMWKIAISYPRTEGRKYLSQ